MAFKVTLDCISCGACEALCPNGAISQGDTIFVIDSDKCTECEGYYDVQQCGDVCPANACIPDPDHVETVEELVAKKARQGAKV